MSSFKDFANNLNNSNINERDLNKVESVINKYSNFSESELAIELAKTIKEQKDNNMYNRENVLSQIDMLSGFLTPEQKEKIKELLNNAENK